MIQAVQYSNDKYSTLPVKPLSLHTTVAPRGNAAMHGMRDMSFVSLSLSIVRD